MTFIPNSIIILESLGQKGIKMKDFKKILKEKVELLDVKIKKDTNLEIDYICKMIGISKSMFIQTILENEITSYAKILKM